MKRNKLIFFVPLAVAIVSFTLLMLAVVNGWMGPSQNVGGNFCESSDGLIKQPANTWSNFGFIIAGLSVGWLMMRGRFSEHNNAFTESDFTPTFFASLGVLLGPCSMAMHATLTPIGGNLDMLSMYLVCAFMTAYALQRFFGLKPLHFTLIFVVIIIICEWVGTCHQHLPMIDYAGNAIFGVFITISVIFEFMNAYVRKIKLDSKWGYLALASLITAFIIWNFWKNDSALCDPHSLIQGHAIWHLLDALAFFFLFRFYVSEERSIANLPGRQAGA